MRIIGCDLHARQQTLAMLDTVTGEVVNRTLMHEGDDVREFYSKQLLQQVEKPLHRSDGFDAHQHGVRRINSASRRSCFCLRGSAARILVASPTWHSIPI